MKNKGIAFKLAVYIVGITVVIVGLIIWRNDTISRTLLLKNVEENASNLTRANVNKIQGVLKSVSKITKNEAHVFEGFEITTDQLKRYIRMIVQNNEEIFGSSAAFEPYGYFKDSMYYAPYYYENGDTIAYVNLSNNDYLYIYQDWYQIPAVMQEPVWSEPYFDEGGGNILMSTYSVPFYKNDNGKRVFNGVVTADISLEWLQKTVSEIKIFESGYAFLITQNGTVVTHPVESYVMNETIFSIAEDTDNPQLREVGRKMIKGEHGFTEFRSVLTGEHSYMFYYPLEEIGWSMALVFPGDELFEDLATLNRRLLMIGIGGALVLLILIVVISKRITSPLTRLAGVTEKIGKGNFDIDLKVEASSREITQLTSSIDMMLRELKNYIRNLKETTAAKEKIESELKIAHDIQQGIIPKIFPPFPERDDVDLYATLDPARDVGGDLYDFFFLDDYELCFAVGDVSGKGVPASLFMAISRTLLRAKATKGIPVNEIVKSMNLELCKGNENSMFVTFFIGLIDLKTGAIRYCNAGHNFPFILRKDCTLEALDKTHGTPLGVFEDIDYGMDEVLLDPKDSLVLYTDGVTEAMNTREELYDDKRLKELLLGYCNKCPMDITMAIVNSVKKFTGEAEQSDDITVLSLTYFMDKSIKSEGAKTMKKLIIKNNIKELDNLNVFLEKMQADWKLPQKFIMNINLVLEEMISNIIFYGYDDKEQHQIEICFQREENGLHIRIMDEAGEFNPMEAPDPADLEKPAEERVVGGLGIHLMKNIMDRIEYKRENEKNILNLYKKI